MRAKFEVVVALALTREHNGRKEILLQKRQNTNIMDNEWFLAACGHVEYGETLHEAMKREAHEELGVAVETQDLQLVEAVAMPMSYMVVVLYAASIERIEGIPKICEPQYTADLCWAEREHLPEKTSSYVEAVFNLLDKKGWKYS